MSEIKDQVREYIVKEYLSGDDQELNDDTQLLTSGIIDSISALQLVEFLEKTFGFEFEAHEVDQENIDTIDLIEAFVKSKKSK